MSFEVFKWSVAAASLVGVVLNIRKDRRCFHIWAVTNAAWTGIDLSHGVWSQAALQFVYFTLAIWGLRQWKHSCKTGSNSTSTTAIASRT